jgi:hypothetical protein
MHDFGNIIDTAIDIKYFSGETTNFQTWRKPSSASIIYILAVGGGGAGGTGNSSTGVGGGGGGSGAQSMYMTPSIFVPDILYIQCGTGGRAPSANGTQTIVAFEANTGGLRTFLLNPFGGGGGSNTGTAGAAGAVQNNTTLERFTWIQGNIVGQAGGAGGAASTQGANVAFPTNGLCVTGGGGGGGANTAVGGGPGANGGGITFPISATGYDFFYPLVGGNGAIASTSVAGAGQGGYISRNNIFNFGGCGAGGASNTASYGANVGGDAMPGCGGGGGGGGTGLNARGFGGYGGHGFVWVISL